MDRRAEGRTHSQIEMRNKKSKSTAVQQKQRKRLAESTSSFCSPTPTPLTLSPPFHGGDLDVVVETFTVWVKPFDFWKPWSGTRFVPFGSPLFFLSIYFNPISCIFSLPFISPPQIKFICFLFFIWNFRLLRLLIFLLFLLLLFFSFLSSSFLSFFLNLSILS